MANRTFVRLGALTGACAALRVAAAVFMAFISVMATTSDRTAPPAEERELKLAARLGPELIRWKTGGFL